jgi:pimeloyl-ACP methyl ester carboxylesterase
MIRTTISKVAALACVMFASQVHAENYSPCPDSDAQPALKSSLCATVIVPAAYANPGPQPAGEIRLFVRQFPASGQSKGTVWLVAGGPGESGASLYAMLDVLRSSFPDFDLMIPDHRGTGYSSRLCPQEESADSPGGMALAGAEWSSCPAHLMGKPELASHFSLTAAAHDLKKLVATSDPAKPVYLYGVSYGTQLVMRALQIGKLSVTGVILDSLVPLQTAAQWDLSMRSHVVDAVGRNVLAACDEELHCRHMMGDKAEAVYRRVLALTQQQPAWLAEIPGKDLKRFLGSTLDVPTARARLPYLIKDLELGRTDELKSVIQALKTAGQSFGAFPQMPVSIPLVSIISTSENNLRPNLTLDNIKKENEQLLFTSSLPGLLVAPGFPAYLRDEFFGKLPAQLPPYDGARSHIAALGKSARIGFVTVTDAPHFVLWTAPECFALHTREFVQGRRLADRQCKGALPLWRPPHISLLPTASSTSP